MAESFSRNADETEWTVKLRPNIKFGNGDPLTADAVKFSFERMAKARVSSAALAATVQSMTIPDPLTIVFKLTSPFGQFPVRPGRGHRGGRQPERRAIAR